MAMRIFMVFSLFAFHRQDADAIASSDPASIAENDLRLPATPGCQLLEAVCFG